MCLVVAGHRIEVGVMCVTRKITFGIVYIFQLADTRSIQQSVSHRTLIRLVSGPCTGAGDRLTTRCSRHSPAEGRCKVRTGECVQRRKEGSRRNTRGG